MKCQEDFLLTVAVPVFVLNLAWTLQQVINTTHTETPTTSAIKAPAPPLSTAQFLASGKQSYTWPSPINIRLRIKVNTNSATVASGQHATIQNFFDNGFPDRTTFRNNQVLLHDQGSPITQAAPAGSTIDILYTLPTGTHLIRFDWDVFIFTGLEDLLVTFSVLP